MSSFRKIFFISIMIILIIGLSFNICFGIDENQFLTSSDKISNTSTNASSDLATDSLTTSNGNSNETLTRSVEQPSTTVSSISSVSNTSTFTNILSIALVVIGILLVLLAIAILLRLHR